MAENLEPNETDNKILQGIEEQASWDVALDKFIRDYADIFVRHQISIGDAYIIWNLNKLHNRLVSVEDTLEEIKEGLANA